MFLRLRSGASALVRRTRVLSARRALSTTATPTPTPTIGMSHPQLAVAGTILRLRPSSAIAARLSRRSRMVDEEEEQREILREYITAVEQGKAPDWEGMIRRFGPESLPTGSPLDRVDLMNRMWSDVMRMLPYQMQVVLVQRKNEPNKGFWSLPGGRVQLGESMGSAFVREALEETGLTLTSKGIKAFTATDAIFRDTSTAASAIANITHHYGIVQFIAPLLSPARNAVLSAGDDASAAEWVDVAPFLVDREITPKPWEPRVATQFSRYADGSGGVRQYSAMVPETIRQAMGVVFTAPYFRSAFQFELPPNFEDDDSAANHKAKTQPTPSAAAPEPPSGFRSRFASAPKFGANRYR